MFASDMDDVFSAFFGGAGGPSAASRGAGRRSRDVGYALPVTLEDLYMGKTVEITRRRSVLCTGCQGSGRKPSARTRSAYCPACRGSGARTAMRQMGMMVQQFQTVCGTCGGTGQYIDAKDRCTQCSGERVCAVECPLRIEVAKGMLHKQHIVLRGMADEHPGGGGAGDFIAELQQVKHSMFAREDCDLHLTHRLSLAEALCGFQFKVTQLDGRELVVRRNRGTITAPGEIQCVVGEGMPIWKRKDKFGDLVISFEVEYPEHLSEAQITLLRGALPPPRSVDTSSSVDAAEVCYVSREQLDTLRNEIAKDEEADAEEEGPTAGCAAQ